MADGTLKVGTITTSSGSGTITLGQSGETVDMTNGSITLNSSMQNTPAFLARSIAQQDISDNTFTKVQFTSEDYDTDNTYDNSSNYRFTPGVAGKYNLYSQVGGYGISNTSQDITISIYKNGSDYIQQRQGFSDMAIQNSGTYALYTSGTVDVSASDYFEVYFKLNTNGVNARIDYNSTNLYTFFGAYRIIGA